MEKWRMYNQKLIQAYDKEGNFEVDAANHSVSDHSCTHRARRIELCEHVVNGESQSRLPIIVFKNIFGKMLASFKKTT